MISRPAVRPVIAVDRWHEGHIATPTPTAEPQQTVADVVGPSDIPHSLASVTPSNGLQDLEQSEFGFRPIVSPRALARLRLFTVRAQIRPRSNSARPPRTVSIKRLRAVVVSAHVSPTDQSAFSAADVSKRSWVDGACRVERVTVSTSPLQVA